MSKVLSELVDAVGAKRDTTWEILKLLAEPELIQRAVEENTPRTFLREANRVPIEIRDRVKEKIINKEYNNREEIIEDGRIAKLLPALKKESLNRNRAKEVLEVRMINDAINRLSIAFQKPF